MNLENANKKHAEWKDRFRKAISEKQTMNVEEISQDCCCPLGQWLHGEAKEKYSHLASYHECVFRHAAFHIEAGKVAATINAGRYVAAESMIASMTPYNLASSSVGVAIIKLNLETHADNQSAEGGIAGTDSGLQNHLPFAS